MDYYGYLGVFTGMARFERLLQDGDIGHYHCIDPHHHLHYLNCFDLETERILKWTGEDSLLLQLEALKKDPLNNLTRWLSRAWDTLMNICLVNSSTIVRRRRLNMWNDTVQMAQRRLLQKRFCAKKCRKCDQKLWTCRHDPFEPMVETLDSDYTATRLTMSNTLFAINYFQQVYSLKLWKISEYHFHKKLLRLFD